MAYTAEHRLNYSSLQKFQKLRKLFMMSLDNVTNKQYVTSLPQ